MQHEKNKKDFIRYITQTTERGPTDTHCTDNTEVTQTTDTEQTTDAKQTTYTKQTTCTKQTTDTDIWTIDTLNRQQIH